MPPQPCGLKNPQFEFLVLEAPVNKQNEAYLWVEGDLGSFDADDTEAPIPARKVGIRSSDNMMVITGAMGGSLSEAPVGYYIIKDSYGDYMVFDPPAFEETFRP